MVSKSNGASLIFLAFSFNNNAIHQLEPICIGDVSYAVSRIRNHDLFKWKTLKNIIKHFILIKQVCRIRDTVILDRFNLIQLELMNCPVIIIKYY